MYCPKHVVLGAARACCTHIAISLHIMLLHRNIILLVALKAVASNAVWSRSVPMALCMLQPRRAFASNGFRASIEGENFPSVMFLAA